MKITKQEYKLNSCVVAKLLAFADILEQSPACYIEEIIAEHLKNREDYLDAHRDSFVNREIWATYGRVSKKYRNNLNKVTILINQQETEY